MHFRVFSMLLVLFFGSYSFHSHAFSAEPPKYSSVRVHVFKKKVSVIVNSIKQLGSKEGQAAIIIACGAFGYDCRDVAEAVGVAATLVSNPSNNEARYKIDSPAGYSLCEAKIIERRHDSGTTFAGSYKVNNAGLDIYTDVPTRVGKSKGIDYTVQLMYVASGDLDFYSCKKEKSAAFYCPKNWCCSPRPINRPGACRKY